MADEPLVAAVSNNDILAARKTITLEALRDRSPMSLPRGTGLRSCLDDACATSSFEPKIGLEASHLGILAQLASRGLGVAILPESVALANAEKLHTIEVTNPRMRGRLALAWRTDGPISPAARALTGRAQAGVANSAADRQPAA